MKNLGTKKKWLSGDIALHVEPPPISIIKTYSEERKKCSNYINIKLHNKHA